MSCLISRDAYEFVDRAVVFPREKVLVVTDIHFEAGHRVSADRVRERIMRILGEYDVSTVVFNGDVFSEFPFVDSGVSVIQEVSSVVDEVVLVEGNHEEMVGGFGKLGCEFMTCESYVFEVDECQVCVTHGHSEVNVRDVDLFVIGHLHPGDALSRPYAACVARSYRSDVVVLPAFTDVGVREVYECSGASPFIPQDVCKEDYTIIKQFE